MHKYIFIMFGAFTVLASSCKKDEIATFTDGNELFFNKFYKNELFPGTQAADSTQNSFFFYPDGTQDITVPLVVNLSGKPLESDITFSLKVVPEETTAAPNEYTIDPSYTFHSALGKGVKNIQDTIYIKIHRSPRIDQLPNGIKLVLELIGNDQVGLGQAERLRSKIIVTTVPSKPVWWDTEVVSNLLGTYTQKKFKLFLNQIDTKGELNKKLIEERPDLAKKMALAFKAWLINQHPVILEENGDVMTVAI